MSPVQARTVTLSVIGELDRATIGQINSLLCALEGAAFDQLRLDLSDATFIDASGIRLVLHVERRAERAGWTLMVLPAAPLVHGVFEICGLDALLPSSRRHSPSGMPAGTDI